jgi:hypothetical protein
MERELADMTAGDGGHKSSNKATLQAQLLKEKRSKLKSILSFALSTINSLTQCKPELASPGSGVPNYFYFSGHDSGLEYRNKSSSSWPFQKGYTAVIKFRCLR